MYKTVSVIIPCYNGEDVINRSIHSVYMQDYNGVIELIVVDDGSTDKSKDYIRNWQESFTKKGHIINYIYQENRGLGGAINTGLKYVTGDYLSLLDADDCLLDGSIRKKADFLDKNPDYVGVRSNGWQDKNGVRKLFTTSENEKSDTNLFDGLIGGSATNWAGSYMVRTAPLFEFYPKREIFPSRYGQNMQILLPLAYKRKFGFIDEPLMIYYLQNDSHSQAANEDEQIRKNEINFYGYREIYLHMVDIIVSDKKEKEYYYNIIESWKYKYELKKSMIIKDGVKTKMYYDLLKKTGRMNLNEKIDFYKETNVFKYYSLKLYRRVRMLFHA